MPVEYFKNLRGWWNDFLQANVQTPDNPPVADDIQPVLIVADATGGGGASSSSGQLGIETLNLPSGAGQRLRFGIGGLQLTSLAAEHAALEIQATSKDLWLEWIIFDENVNQRFAIFYALPTGIVSSVDLNDLPSQIEGPSTLDVAGTAQQTADLQERRFNTAALPNQLDLGAPEFNEEAGEGRMRILNQPVLRGQRFVFMIPTANVDLNVAGFVWQELG